METIPRILIVHNGENVDGLKQGLLKAFPVLEDSGHIVTTDIEFLYQMVVSDRYEFDILVATSETPVLEVEKTLRALRERAAPITIGKIVLPEFKFTQIPLKDWKFNSDS